MDGANVNEDLKWLMGHLNEREADVYLISSVGVAVEMSPVRSSAREGISVH